MPALGFWQKRLKLSEASPFDKTPELERYNAITIPQHTSKSRTLIDFRYVARPATFFHCPSKGNEKMHFSELCTSSWSSDGSEIFF